MSFLTRHVRYEARRAMFSRRLQPESQEFLRGDPLRRAAAPFGLLPLCSDVFVRDRDDGDDDDEDERITA